MRAISARRKMNLASGKKAMLISVRANLHDQRIFTQGCNINIGRRSGYISPANPGIACFSRRNNSSGIFNMRLCCEFLFTGN
jgi:hypothetical protein